MENDYELIMLYQEKNEIAEQILFTKYQKIIALIIKNYQPTLNKLQIDKNELYGICLKNYYQALDEYDIKKEANFNTYITTIIKRTIKKEIVKASRIKNKINIDQENYEQCVLIDNNIDPLNQVIEEENYTKLKNLIKNTLNSQELLVYTLVLQGLSYKEISQKTNVNYSSIIRLKNKIKHKMQLVLENNHNI